MGARWPLGVGLAGLGLFALGLVMAVWPLIVSSSLSRRFSFGLLGPDLGVSGAVWVAVWPLAVASLVAGFGVMLDRDRRPGIACWAAWSALGVVAMLGGGEPGLVVVGALALWQLTKSPHG